MRVPAPPSLSEQSSDHTTLSIREAGDLVRRQAVSPVELTRACLERIERLDPGLNAFITVTAEQALEMGLLNAAVAPEAVLPAALELAERLAQGPTTAYACVKASLRFAADSTLVEALAEEERLQTLAGRTQDHAAAVRSFLAKQPATFTGR